MATQLVDRRNDTYFPALVNTAIVLRRVYGPHTARSFLLRMDASADIIARVIAEAELRHIKGTGGFVSPEPTGPLHQPVCFRPVPSQTTLERTLRRPRVVRFSEKASCRNA